MQAGLSSRGARLMRLGENALYRLPAHRIVVRIARSVDQAAKVNKELAVARWLASAAFPAARVVEEIDQPLVADGRVVSFWHEITPDPDRRPSLPDLAGLLRMLHDMPDPGLQLPAVDLLDRVPERMKRARGVAPGDLAFLRDRYGELAERYEHLACTSAHSLIHGDAHRGNVMISNGSAVLLDFEMVALGPREWDLVPTAIALSRFRLSRAEYEEFVRAYGRDVTEWGGFATLRDIRELTMTTWLMQNIGESPQVAAEFAIRVASLREGDRERAWHVF